MVSYSDIKAIAANLSAAGCTEAAEALATAHVGIFNSLELYMAWRFHLQQALGGAELPAVARDRAQAVLSQLNAELS